MIHLQFFALSIYSLALAHAGIDTIGTKEISSFELILLAAALSLPIFAFLGMKIITDLKTILDFSDSLTKAYDKSPLPNNVIDLAQARRTKEKTAQNETNKAA